MPGPAKKFGAILEPNRNSCILLAQSNKAMRCNLRRGVFVRLLLGISLLMAVLAGSFRVSAATQLVRMVNFAFQPSRLTNNVGDTVVWTNTTTTGHNVVSTDSAWDPSPLFTRPDTFSVTFTQPGTYNYFCSPHRSFGMTGAIVVQAAANQAPVVALTNPPPGLTLVAPATIVLGASASDPDGTIAGVEFFSGETSLGTSTTSPYSFTVNNLVGGAYSFTAKATDNLGLSTTSETVSVTVLEQSAPFRFSPTLSITNGTLALHLTVTPGMNYSIESAADFAGWQPVTNFLATQPEMEIGVPLVDPGKQFFRAKLLPNP